MMTTTSSMPGNAAEHLSTLLLELAGRGAGRMGTARRHVTVLDAAMPYMNTVQRHEATRRIRALGTRWGPMLPHSDNEREINDIPTIMRVGRWLSTRRTPARHLDVLHRAAVKVAQGDTSISSVMDHAFAQEIDYVLSPVGCDSFKEWLIELRIAQREAKGRYVPGLLCNWWVDQMILSKDKRSAYQACLKQSEEIRWFGTRSWAASPP
jgi:hypothetical protein